MITHIEISGFKSFWDFEADFAPFTVVAGANASGKSNLFDAMRLLSDLATKDLRSAFSAQQRGDLTELFSLRHGYDLPVSQMRFAVEVLVSRQVTDNWGNTAELNNTRLRYELWIERSVDHDGMERLNVIHERLVKIPNSKDEWVNKYLKRKKGLWKTQRAGGSAKPYIETDEEGGKTVIKLRQDGHQGGRDRVANTVNQTVLGGVNSADFPHAFAMQQELAGWKYLQLNPAVVRLPASMDEGIDMEVGADGSHLAAVMYRMKREDSYLITKVSNRLCSFLKEYQSVDVERDDANRIYIIKLKNRHGIEFTSRVLSEGTLRLLTLCVLLNDPRHGGLVCFEEPENGIHPGRIGQMIDLLRELAGGGDEQTVRRQVIVNTHSSRVLKYIFDKCQKDDDIQMVLSRTTTRFDSIDNQRVSMNTTRMIPISRDPQQPLPGVSEMELQASLIEVNELLEKKEGGE